MLGYLFLFYERMGRLQYFLWSWIFVPVIFFLVAFVLILIFVFVLHAGNSAAEVFAFIGLLTVVFFWMEFSLKAVRIRDIGWKPGIVIPIILSINFIDICIAWAAPGLAYGRGVHTIVAPIINILCELVLLFTPTDGQEMVPFVIPGLSLPRMNLGFLHRQRPELPVQPKQRQQPFEERRYPREKVPFGRRGLT